MKTYINKLSVSYIITVLLSACFFLNCGNSPVINTQAVLPDSIVELDGIYYSLGKYGDSLPFSDIPTEYRELYVTYCSPCHSNNWSVADDRKALNLNTWRDILDYGPLKLYLSAKSGAMPLKGGPVPDKVLKSVSLFLAQGVGTVDNLPWGSISTILDSNIRTLTERYCGSCHGHQGTAVIESDLRTYEDWVLNRKPILRVLSEDNRENDNSMPEKDSKQRQEWDAHPEDQKILIDWLNSGLPN